MLSSSWSADECYPAFPATQCPELDQMDYPNASDAIRAQTAINFWIGVNEVVEKCERAGIRFPHP